MGGKPGAHQGKVCSLVWLLWGAGKDEANQNMQGWACPAKICRFYPWAGEGIGEIQGVFLKDTCGGRARGIYSGGEI